MSAADGVGLSNQKMGESISERDARRSSWRPRPRIFKGPPKGIPATNLRDRVNPDALLDSGRLLSTNSDLLGFEGIGELHKGIVDLRTALACFERSDPKSWCCMDALATALRQRHALVYVSHPLNRDNEILVDLPEAVALHSAAVRRARRREDQYTGLDLYMTRLEYQSNLAVDLLLMANLPSKPPSVNKTQTLDYLGEAILLAREVVEHQHLGRKSLYLHRLAIAVEARFRKTSKTEDLEEAISLHLRAVENAEEGDSNYTSMHYTLGKALWARYGSSGMKEDLEACIDHFMKATVMKSPSFYLNNLAEALFTRFKLHHDPDDLDKAVTSLTDAVRDGTTNPRQHLLQASFWMLYLQENPVIKDYFESRGLDQRFMKYCGDVVTLRLSVASPALATDVRLQRLMESNDVPRLLAHYLVALNKPSLALEILESGRSAFWEQGFRLKNTVDSNQHISRDLDHQSHWNRFTPRARDIIVREKEDLEHGRLATSFEQLNVTEHAPTLSLTELAQSSVRGPVVVLIEGNPVSYAVLVVSPSVMPRVLQLPKSSALKLNMWVAAVQQARGTPDSEENTVPDVANERHGSRFRTAQLDHILANLWTDIVKPIISELGLTKQSGRDRPRIWWCPSGQFSFLPLHAAGNDMVSLSHFAVSSYTPSLKALRRAQTIAATRTMGITQKPKVAVFTCANTSGLYSAMLPIPNVIKEYETISGIVPNEMLVHVAEQPMVDFDSWKNELNVDVGVHTDSGSDEEYYTKRAREVPIPSHTEWHSHSDSSIMHFACHGQQFNDTPLSSALFTPERVLNLERLMQTNYPNAYFAFLSACQSAAGSRSQSEESVHLAAVMMFLGFSTVVGTLWTMNDQDGPHVSKYVYEALFRGGVLSNNPDDIAYALESAVQKLRDDGVPAARWATYIHMGV